MATAYSDSEILNLLKRLDDESAKKREAAIFEVRRKQIIEEEIVLKLVRMAFLDPKDYVRGAAQFTLEQTKFRKFVEQSPLIIEEQKVQQKSKTEKLYWPPDQTTKETVLTIFLKEKEVRELLGEDQRKRTIETTKSVLISKAKYVGGHPLISQSRGVVLSLTQMDFVIYSIDSQYEIVALSSIPLLDITRTYTGRPKTAREIYDSDDRRTIDVIQQSPFLILEFKLHGYQYAVSFESFEKGSSPQDWANKIIAQQYQLRSGAIP